MLAQITRYFRLFGIVVLIASKHAIKNENSIYSNIHYIDGTWLENTMES